MRACWQLYRFDYARFSALSSALFAATEAEHFEALAFNADTRTLANALYEQDCSPEIARAAFVQAACCLGEPVPLDRSFQRLLTEATRRRDAVDASKTLTALLTGTLLPEGMHPGQGLCGLLSSGDTLQLLADFDRMMLALRPRRRRRRGGLLGVARHFVQQLFDRTPDNHEVLALVRTLLTEAVVRGEGVAVVEG